MLLLDKITQQVPASELRGLVGAPPWAHVGCDAHGSGVAHVCLRRADDGGVLHVAMHWGADICASPAAGLFSSLGWVVAHGQHCEMLEVMSFNNHSRKPEAQQVLRVRALPARALGFPRVIVCVSENGSVCYV